MQDYFASIFRVLIAAVMLGVALPSGATVADLPRRNLPNLRVNDITQDSLGYIWIATPNGLCRNLGVSFDVFLPEKNNPASLPSNNIVEVIYRHPDIWVATSRGVASRNIYSNGFVRYGSEKGPVTDFINGFLEIDNRLLVYGSGGLYEVDPVGQKLKHLYTHPGGQIVAGAVADRDKIWLMAGNTLVSLDSNMSHPRKYALPTDMVVTYMVFSNGKMFLGTSVGLRGFDPISGKVSHVAPGTVLDHCEIHSILSTDDDVLLVSTRRNGELIYDIHTGKVSTSSPQFNFSALPSSDVMVGFIDRDSNVWLGTLDQGLLLAYNKYSIFNHDRELFGAFRNKFVTTLCADPQGMVWIGTRYDGLYRYDPVTGALKSIKLPAKDVLVDHLSADSHGRIWVGTNSGLYVSHGDAHGDAVNFSRMGSSIGTTAEDSHGNIWTGTPGDGIYVYNPDLSLRHHIAGNGMHNRNITKIIRLNSGKMLASAYTDGLYLIDPTKYTITPLDSRYQDQWTSAIDLLQGRDGRIWVGTYDNYLLSYDPKTKELRQYSDFPSQDIVALVEDSDGKIWVSSSNGLYSVNPATGDRYSYVDGLSEGNEQYHEKAVARTADGTMYFGGNSGLRQVSPARDSVAPRDIPVYLTGITPLYRDIADADSVTDPAFVRKLTLAHSNNGVVISFIGLNYGARVQYSYMLKGYDRDWIEAGEYPRAVYSNLPSGDFEFLVRTRTSGNWSKPVRLLDLEVKCAPWRHPVAIIFYVIILASLVLLAIRLHIRLKLEKERMDMAEKKVIAERNIATSKINFFNNISHELRTPLTLILAPVRYLLGNFTRMSAEDIRKNLEFVNKNVQRMLHLTTQILNFREMEGETPPLAVSTNDITSQLESIVGLFNIYAAERGVTIELVCHIREKNLWYDADSVEKMINNLLFNAIKYTPDNGHISVRAELTRHPEYIAMPEGGLYMELAVIDDGIGIDRSQSKWLFTRFRRLMAPFAQRKTPGFGIGLNFVQKLVDLHHGKIAGRPNGLKGMTFTIDIPVEKEAYAESELAPEKDTVQQDSAVPSHIDDADDSLAAEDALVDETLEDEVLEDEPLTDEELNADDLTDDALTDDALTEEELTEEELTEAELAEAALAEVEEKAAPAKHKLLIVEDQPELAEFISSIFAQEFDVIRAANGLEGAEKAHDERPAIIVSDIMMPIMDGISMLERIKNDPETSSIPVIVLTAKNSDSDKVKGFRTGADMYLSKPFSPEVLVEAVRSVLANKERQRRQLAGSAGSGDSSVATANISEFDRRFLRRLYDYIDQNLSDPDLNINLLCRELCMSRTSFYRKVKDLTNLTPYDMLRIFRLNRSAELLRSRRYSLGEIADLTGFSTHSHFSTLFRKHFGMTPTEYLHSIE